MFIIDRFTPPDHPHSVCSWPTIF